MAGAGRVVELEEKAVPRSVLEKTASRGERGGQRGGRRAEEADELFQGFSRRRV